MVDSNETNTGDEIPEETKTNPAAGTTSEGENASGDAPGDQDPNGHAAQISKAQLTDLVPDEGEGFTNNLDLLMDVSVPISVELGRSTMKIEDILQLLSGSVIELDKRADEPVDLKVNGRLVAKGEIVVVEDYFGIRVSEIVDPNKVLA